MAKTSDDFYHGVIACLAIVAVYDQQTLFDEIIGTMNRAELIRVARKNGDMRWSGLSQYGYGRPNNAMQPTRSRALKSNRTSKPVRG